MFQLSRTKPAALLGAAGFFVWTGCSSEGAVLYSELPAVDSDAVLDFEATGLERGWALDAQSPELSPSVAAMDIPGRRENSRVEISRDGAVIAWVTALGTTEFASSADREPTCSLPYSAHAIAFAGDSQSVFAVVKDELGTRIYRLSCSQQEWIASVPSDWAASSLLSSPEGDWLLANVVGKQYPGYDAWCGNAYEFHQAFAYRVEDGSLVRIDAWNLGSWQSGVFGR